MPHDLKQYQKVKRELTYVMCVCVCVCVCVPLVLFLFLFLFLTLHLALSLSFSVSLPPPSLSVSHPPSPPSHPPSLPPTLLQMFSPLDLCGDKDAEEEDYGHEEVDDMDGAGEETHMQEEGDSEELVKSRGGVSRSEGGGGGGKEEKGIEFDMLLAVEGMYCRALRCAPRTKAWQGSL
jgi:hypothetical protein